jgi:Mrp family chromosome partitioning ATPase
VRASDELGSQITSEQMLRITNRLLTALKAGETLIGCTGVRQADPSASFALHAALAAARLGCGPVLVVDANFTAANRRNVNSQSTLGLSNLLDGETDTISSIQHSNVEGLDILPIGNSFHLARSLLTSTRMQSIFKGLLQYKLVFMDIGSILQTTESLIIAAKMDAIIAIASSGELTQREALQLKSELAPLSARFLGLVLTDIK